MERKSNNKIVYCNKCGECCRSDLGPLILPNDIIQISKAINETECDFLQKYCNQKIFLLNNRQFYLYFLKTEKNGCIFLRNSLCSIYNIRPYQCRYAPYQCFSSFDCWDNWACIDINVLKECDTMQNDLRLIKEALEYGYSQSRKSHNNDSIE